MPVADRHADHARDRARDEHTPALRATRAAIPRAPCRRSRCCKLRGGLGIDLDRQSPDGARGRVGQLLHPGQVRAAAVVELQRRVRLEMERVLSRVAFEPGRRRSRARTAIADAERAGAGGPARCRPGARHRHSSCRRRAAARRRPSASAGWYSTPILWARSASVVSTARVSYSGRRRACATATAGCTETAGTSAISDSSAWWSGSSRSAQAAESSRNGPKADHRFGARQGIRHAGGTRQV